MGPTGVMPVVPPGSSGQPLALLTDRQIQGTSFPEESNGTFSGDKRNTGRARQTGYNELTAQTAARQKNQRALYLKLGLDPDKQLAAFNGMGSTESGVLANRAAINDVEQAAANRAEKQAAAIAAEEASQGSSVLGQISEKLKPVARYVGTAGKLAGSTLGGISAANNIGEALSNYRENKGFNMRNVAQGVAGLGGLVGMIPTLPTQVVGGAMQGAMAVPDIYDYVTDASGTNKKQVYPRNELGVEYVPNIPIRQPRRPASPSISSLESQ
jgi:hypothetical protein